MTDEDKNSNNEPEEKEEKEENEENGLEFSIGNSLISPGADFDTCLQAGYKSNCTACNHPAIKDAVILYFKVDKDVKAVRRWFIEEHDFDFNIDQLRNHFNRHVDDYITKEMVLREQTRLDLIERASRRPEMDRFSLMREMTWDIMMKAYSEIISINLEKSGNKKEFREMVKAHTDLVKSHNDICQKEWDMLGQGKSEEEQREIMQKFVVSSLKKYLEPIKNEHPEAYLKVASKLGIEAPPSLDEGGEDDG